MEIKYDTTIYYFRVLAYPFFLAVWPPHEGKSFWSGYASVGNEIIHGLEAVDEQSAKRGVIWWLNSELKYLQEKTEKALDEFGRDISWFFKQ